MPGCAKAALHPGARHFVFDVRRNKVQRKPPRPEGEAWRDETGTSHPVPVFFSQIATACSVRYFKFVAALRQAKLIEHQTPDRDHSRSTLLTSTISPRNVRNICCTTGSFSAVSRRLCFSRRSVSCFETAGSLEACGSRITNLTPTSLPVTSLQTSRSTFTLSLFAKVSRMLLPSGANSTHNSLSTIDA